MPAAARKSRRLLFEPSSEQSRAFKLVFDSWLVTLHIYNWITQRNVTLYFYESRDRQWSVGHVKRSTDQASPAALQLYSDIDFKAHAKMFIAIFTLTLLRSDLCTDKQVETNS